MPQSLFFVWPYGVDQPVQTLLPANKPADPIAGSALQRSGAIKSTVNEPKQIAQLPVSTMLSNFGEPAGTFEQLMARTHPAPDEAHHWQERARRSSTLHSAALNGGG